MIKNIKEKFIEAGGSVSGIASVLGSWQVCHNVCLGIVAVLALHEVGNNANIVNTAGTWLLNSRSIVFTGELPTASNQWFVQVVSSVAGSCVLTNYDLDSSLGVSVDTSQGYVPWFNVDSGILTSTTSSLNLDCSSLGSTPVLSLINKKDVSGVENYFIKQEEHGKKNITVSLNFYIGDYHK